MIESDSFADTISKFFNEYCDNETCWISSPKILIDKVKKFTEQYEQTKRELDEQYRTKVKTYELKMDRLKKQKMILK